MTQTIRENWEAIEASADKNTLLRIVSTRVSAMLKRSLAKLSTDKTSLENLAKLSDAQLLFQLGIKSAEAGCLNEELDLLSDEAIVAQGYVALLATIESVGGMKTAAQIEGYMGITRQSVYEKRIKQRILYMSINGENVYPVFQFDPPDSKNRRAVAKNMVKVLAAFPSNVDAGLRFSFFIRPSNNPDAPDEKIFELLKSNIDSHQLAAICRQAAVDHGS